MRTKNNKMSILEKLGLPESAGILFIALSIGLALSPYASGVEVGGVKLPSVTGTVAVLLAIAGPLLVAGSIALFFPWLTFRALPAPIQQSKLRSGITHGWQLGRLEFIGGSNLQEARSVEKESREAITLLLAEDGFKDSLTELDCKGMINKILTRYSATDIQKHAAVLNGIGAMRASLIGASSDQIHNQEMETLSRSTFLEINEATLPAKELLVEEIVMKKPSKIVELVEIVNSHWYSL